MGCGKTTAGKRLARILDLEFVDLDELIELKSGKSIQELFDDQGEESFRELESAILKEALESKGILLSTGGGAPCFYDNMDRINAMSVSVYLKMSINGLVQRLINAKSKRPLIADKTEAELAHFITDHLADRKKFYERAHLSFDALNLDNKYLEGLADEIRKIVQ